MLAVNSKISWESTKSVLGDLKLISSLEIVQGAKK